MSIFVFICLQLSSPLLEYPGEFGALLNCMRNHFLEDGLISSGLS